MNIDVGKTYGCLTVLDNGEEFNNNVKLREEVTSELTNRIANNSSMPYLFAKKKSNATISVHYKCVCKCGKIHYYNKETLLKKPKYCVYPISIRTKYTYSTRDSNATYNKRKKYENIECVILCDKSECKPSQNYCFRYNSDKIKEYEKKKDKAEQIVSNLPRIYTKNYNYDFTGKQCESLYIESCVNEHFEPDYIPYYIENPKAKPKEVVVFKQYMCRCIICGKKQLITCDQFGIHPPSRYGLHAYNGYWSDVFCDCHPISSFQWIVNKILFEANAKYRVEETFPDLYGYGNKNLLRYDFALLNDDGSVKELLECQGEQHYSPIDEFGGTTQFSKQIANDNLKRKYAQEHNIPLHEISYKDKQIDKVYEILYRLDWIK